MKLPAIFFPFFLLSFTGMANDTTDYHTFLKFAPGIAVHSDLRDLNASLESENISPVRPWTFSTIIQGRIQKNRSAFQLNFSIHNLNNGEELPKKQVIFNLYHFSINYGSDLLPQNPQLRLEPFIGLGGTLGDFFIFSQDSAQTFNQALNGAQNLFYEQPSLALFGEAGIRFDFGLTQKRIAYFAELTTLQQLTPWKWELEAMKLTQLTAVRFNLGFRFKLF